MAKPPPSLLNLSVSSLKNQFLYGDDNDDTMQAVYELPTELFDCLLKQLPALALEKLQSKKPSEYDNGDDYGYDWSSNGRKRARNEKFNMAWRELFHSRWPESIGHSLLEMSAQNVLESQTTFDWQQKYWEMHIQNCLDAAAEIAMLPSFNGCIGEVRIPDVIIRAIGCERHLSCLTRDHSKLRNHCEQFGSYARFLRLQNVLCTGETCHLLRNSKLQGLILRRISSEVHVSGAYRILNQNKTTISSLEFLNCRLSSAFIEAICDSLHMEGKEIHKVKHFAVKTSRFLDINLNVLPPRLVSFLTSGRSLDTLSFCDDHIGRNFAKLLFVTLLNASTSLSSLDLSENHISGWLSDFRSKSIIQPHSCIEINKSLRSLSTLNLRGNNLQKDDVEDLMSALVYIPVLKKLDLSDNPIEDDGVRSFIPYFAKASEHFSLVHLNLKNCKLSCSGATKLLKVLSTLKYPLASLSLADNDLGSQLAPQLGKFFCTSIISLDIRDIGLGSSGFLELRRNLPEALNLVSINISENRGGIQAAEFLAELISKGPELTAVNAGYNLMPLESLPIIHSALKVAKGKLQHLDLTGNQRLQHPGHAALLSEFQFNGKPLVQIPSFSVADARYDDDP